MRSAELDGWRVLVPRAAHQAPELSRWLRRHGAAVRELPAIAVEPPPDVAPLDEALARLRSGGFAWVVFTSANTVHAVHRRCVVHGWDVREAIAADVAAVGERTAAALARLGVRTDLVPDGEQSAEGLVRSWPAARAGRVLVPCSDLARPVLTEGLTGAGWRCERVVAYRTVPAAPPSPATAAAIAGGGFDAVAFTSSSTVRNLVAFAAPPPSTVVAAIGRQTASTAREHGLRVRVVAPRPAARELAAALARYAVSGRRGA
ncbi:uroporphyrinogen-III synthase [Actinomadura kijaniata]|uniref:uroporphyrinogen-III synthase n=1 Tax=Actinomadura kijaniata TaxID=46161 RepID=UPI00082C3C66|nr:uroporphyrinogen-III synthase [Actinomadura kijaniata]